MRTVDTLAFDGRVVFKCKYNTLQTALDVETNQDKLAAIEHPLKDRFKGAVDTLLYILVITDDIEFHFQGDELAMLQDFRDFWKAYKKSGDLKLALDWRIQTSTEIINPWIEAVNTADHPYRNPVTLPYAALTQEEKDALADKNSPLEQSA